MVFDLDKSTPHLPSTINFQIPVSVEDITIHHCIVDEGASTCIMSNLVWKKLGSPELKPYDITIRVYDEHPYVPIGLYLMVCYISSDLLPNWSPLTLNLALVNLNHQHSLQHPRRPSYDRGYPLLP